MAKQMIAGNWKMNMSVGELSGFFESLKKNLPDSPQNVTEKVEVVIAAPYTLLAEAVKLTAGSGIKIAAQNVHFESSGAYTGEISVSMLKEIGCEATLIGHSERRQYFNETDETVAKKVSAAQKAGLMTIACIGESLEQRQADKTMEVVSRQLKAVTEATEDYQKLVVAYEPVWAIGTGLAATPEQAQEVHRGIRKELASAFGEQKAAEIAILYGGSMKPSNCPQLISQEDIEGGLIGGASLKPEGFAEMVSMAFGRA